MTTADEPIEARRPQPDEAEAVLSKPSWRKILVLAAVVGALLAVVYWSPLRGYLNHAQELSHSIKNLGLLAPLVLTASVALLVAVGFPRLVFCFIAGMALGFWSGLVWTQLGTLLGNYAVFLLVRRGGRDWAQRYLSKRGSWHSFIHEEGISGVILARQVPVPGVVVNLACAMLPLRHRDYLLGTLIGQLPQAIPCTLIGAGVLKNSFGKSLGLISLAVVAAVVAWMGVRALLRAQRGKSAAASAATASRPPAGPG